MIVTQRVGFSKFSATDYGRLLLLYILLFVIRAMMVALLSPLLVRTGFGFGFRRAIGELYAREYYKRFNTLS